MKLLKVTFSPLQLDVEEVREVFLKPIVGGINTNYIISFKNTFPPFFHFIFCSHAYAGLCCFAPALLFLAPAVCFIFYIPYCFPLI